MDEDEYNEKLKDPSTWFLSGRRMYHAANISLDIWTDAIKKEPELVPIPLTPENLHTWAKNARICCDLFPVYMMLMGYALENLAKGLELMKKTKPGGDLAGRSNLTLSDLGFAGSQGHKTLERLERLKIFLSPDERDAVEITDDHVIWAGKYGVPKSPGQHKASEDMSICVHEWRKYADALTPLFDRLYEEFREQALHNFDMELR